jgi:DNA methyltransferase 1-associated protein 1
MSSEILDVLNIQSTGTAKKKQKTEQPKVKQLTGINRELYQLLGQNTPPVAVRNQQKFKDRLNALERPSPWTWASFKNNARSDGLRLHHWVKGSKETVEASELPYKFEKYNTELNIPDFTEEDYNNFISDVDQEDEMDVDEKEIEPVIVKTEDTEQPEIIEAENTEKLEENSEGKMEEKDVDKGEELEAEKEPEAPKPPVKKRIPWDYQETRYLFDLSKAFDLKWIVIHDRYNFEEDRERTIEDLEERFYSVCQRILIYENEKDDTAQNSNLISNLNFSKKKEVDRKAYLNRLLERSPAEIAEEESLLIEAKKFEAAAKNTMTERSQLLQLLDSPQATGSISQYLTSQGLTQLYNQLMTEKRKRRVDSPAPENPLTALNEKIKQQHLARQKQLQQEKLEQQKKIKESPISALLSKNLTPREEIAFGLKVHQERISPGVYLRSSKISTFKPNVQTRISGILNELGLGKKPVMATEKIVRKQDELHKVINVLLDLKRQVDKLEAESEMLK